MEGIARRIDHVLAELKDLREEAESFLEVPRQEGECSCPIESLAEEISEQILVYCQFLSWARAITDRA